jgi:hypothetical protein
VTRTSLTNGIVGEGTLSFTAGTLVITGRFTRNTMHLEGSESAFGSGGKAQLIRK